MEITKHLFFNLCVLIIFLFICFVLTEKKSKLPIPKKTLYIWCVIMLGVCFQFSFLPGQNLHLDLRVIPVVLGGLYAGIGPPLALTLIIIRGFHGIDLGFVINSFLYGALAFYFWIFYPSFWNKSPKYQILVSIATVSVISILTASFLDIMCPQINHFDVWVAYLIIPTIGIGMISYTIEFAKNYLQMQQRLIKTEKLEAVEQMGASISHEIRNPLTAAKGFVQLRSPAIPSMSIKRP